MAKQPSFSSNPSVQCMEAFLDCNKQESLRMLNRVRQPAAIRTKFTRMFAVVMLASLVHIAAYNGWIDVVCELVHTHGCDVHYVDDAGHNAVHYAARRSRLEMVIYLTAEMNCTPLQSNEYGWTPLHIACYESCLPIVEYLMVTMNCSPSKEDNNGMTPLHWACVSGSVSVVKYLLSSGKVNPLAKTKHFGLTPAHKTLKYEIVKLFKPFEQCLEDFPVHLYTKVILIGYSGVGKTTISQLTRVLATGNRCEDSTINVKELTAGIIPTHIGNSMGPIRNMILYDFAGQQNYYSSHSAILENIMLHSSVVFICMIDLTNTVEQIKHAVHYWMNFIECACPKETSSEVIFIGSHADQVNSTQELECKSECVQSIAKLWIRRPKHLNYGGFVMMDCRKADSEKASYFMTLLSQSQRVVQANLPVISYYCHVLFAFLSTKINDVACKLEDLIRIIAAENDCSLPTSSSVLVSHLTILNDKAVILFFENKLHLMSSWIVLKKEELLTEVIGTLFAPEGFSEYRKISSNTGIVSLKTIKEEFPDHDPEMIASFLQSLELCQPIQESTLANTNLKIIPHLTAAGNLLFCPALINEERPSNLIKPEVLQFGWGLGCVDPHQFLSSWFLHVLLLKLAYIFPLTDRNLDRMCMIWSNGICWNNDDGVTTIVELITNNQWVIVAMSLNADSFIQHAKLRSSIITLVRQLQQERCPNLDLFECLISPDFIQQYPFANISAAHIFELKHIARSILLQKPVVCCSQDARVCLPTQSLSFEPYYRLSPSFVCQLFNDAYADQPVPTSLVQAVQSCCQQPQLKPVDHKSLREYVNSLSIFSGRNPLMVAGLSEVDVLNNENSLTAVASKIDKHLTIGDLFEVLNILRDVVNWQSLGLALGLLYPTLLKIEKDCQDIDKCKMEMLAAWLQQKDNVPQTGKPSWSTLWNKLKTLGENELAEKLSELCL